VKKIKVKVLLCLIVSVFSVLNLALMETHSVRADNYNLIDNYVFDNTSSMSTNQIQSFLNQFPNSCLSNYRAPDPISWSSYGTLVSAAQVIKDSSTLWQINPQVLLTTLQKEEQLVDGSQGCSNWKLWSSMGYNCPGSATYPYGYLDIINSATYSGGVPPDLAGGVSQTCVAQAKNIGFSAQVSHGAWQLSFARHRSEGDGNINWDGDNTVIYYGYMTAGTRPRVQSGTPSTYSGIITLNDNSVVTLANGATASLYSYTPYLQSFDQIFQNFFGIDSIYSNIYNGIDYSAVFDASFYFTNNTDVATACNNDRACGFNHFIAYGINEGRQAAANFNVQTYRQNYQDLRWIYGIDLAPYYLHYINYGQREGRVATGTPTFNPVTSYNGINYASIYSYSTYMSTYSDLQNVFGSKNDDTGALLHFINTGMNEGRVANPNFNVSYYRNRYPDLRAVFGSNLKAYYMHYLVNGQGEGRVANTDAFVGTSVRNGVDYAAVYNFNTYTSTYSDIKNAFGSDDNAALQHFVTFGMKEGRQASTTFNVFTYKNRYADLQKAFGNNLPAYYMHYITNGQREGRVAV
jgi:hypothetical protein